MSSLPLRAEAAAPHSGIGTFFFAGMADRYGRKTVFTVSLLVYSLATLIMTVQTTATGINLWRLIAGIGAGVRW